MMDGFVLTGTTQIEGDSKSRSIEYAVERLYRDIKKRLTTEVIGSGKIYFDSDHSMEEEEWEIQVGRADIFVHASSDLGIIYAFHYLSEQFLGIQPFWFWMDQKIEKSKEIFIPAGIYRSKGFDVRYRGWFINDETFIGRWNPDDDEAYAWEMAFEALLRCGGNMVIPGSNNNLVRYRLLAADMGLMLTHHHVEPLGAEMFSAVYPDLKPSYEQYPELFEGLWKKAILKCKDRPTVWAIGLRGQGDGPYWPDDGEGSEKSNQEKASFLSAVMKRQYDMVREEIPDAVICTNLYGEMMEYYREGGLELLEDVIRIWGDNGYGKMVNRRRGNHNPRTLALPQNDKEAEGEHGIYYHISFYDLQAASHTALPPFSPEYYKKELGDAVSHGLTKYWIINCSNIRPHVPLLELTARMWTNTSFDSNGFYEGFASRYYLERTEEIAGLYDRYTKLAIHFGPHDDEVAGEQFYTHSVKTMAHQWMMDLDKAAVEFQWAKAADSLEEQIQWLAKQVKGKEKAYKQYLQDCESISQEICDKLTLSVYLHYLGCKGLTHFCRAWELRNENHGMESFYECGLAAEAFAEADLKLRSSEQGIWKNFYQYECFADYKFTAHILKRLMGWIRDQGEGPIYYTWQVWLYNQETGKGEIITNNDNHLTEVEFFQRLKALRREQWKNDLIVWNRV